MAEVLRGGEVVLLTGYLEEVDTLVGGNSSLWSRWQMVCSAQEEKLPRSKL